LLDRSSVVAFARVARVNVTIVVVARSSVTFARVTRRAQLDPAIGLRDLGSA
jgi:hypothetical protein